MKISSIKSELPEAFYSVISKQFTELRPAQEKSIKAGLLEGKNLLVCTPTASGKTIVAEMAFSKAILEKEAKAIYIVPLKALATEKYRDFKEKYGKLFRIALSIGDLDSAEPRLAEYDLIICTAEKLDSLIRHYVPWLTKVKCVIVDEVHLLNDPGRGPTLEILITILRQLLKDMQLIALSATIGNPEELAEWLNAELVIDDWRPVRLDKGIYLDGEVEFES